MSDNITASDVNKIIVKKVSEKRKLHYEVDGILGKNCSKCKNFRSLEEYNKLSSAWDKLRHECKNCLVEYRNNKRLQKILKKESENSGEYAKIIIIDDESEDEAKKCIICDILKNKSEYSKNNNKKDKLDSRCKDCVKALNKKRRAEKTKTKEYKILPFDMESKDWQLKGANLIRMIDENTIEVKLTKNQTMITDIQFLEICQKRKLCSHKSGKPGAQYYAAISIDSKLERFHGHITGFKMVDHINGNPLDNRLCNLRKTTCKLNNNNKHIFPVKSDKFPPGVRIVDDRLGSSFQARIKQDGKECSRSFGIKKYGYDEAKKLAIEAREELLQKYESNNRSN